MKLVRPGSSLQGNNMTEPLIKVGPAGPMTSGFKPSVDPESAEFWLSGMNVAFRKQGIEKTPGYIEVVDVNDSIYEIQQELIDGRQTVYLGGARKVYKWDSSFGLVPFWQFPSAGAAVRIQTWGSYAILTNGVDTVKLWKDGAIESIANLPFAWAKVLHRSNVHMLAANTSNGSNRIEWCAASNIEDWVPTRANSAGNYTIRELAGEIKAMVSLSAAIAVYSPEKLVVGSYSGRPFTFNFDRSVLTGIGAVGGRSIVSVGDRNYGMGRQGIFATDGVSFEYADEPDIQQWVRDNVDFTQGEKVVGYYNGLLEAVVWHFPSTNGGYGSVPYYYKKKVFGPDSSIAVTGVAERLVFDTPIAVIGGKFVYLNSGVDAGSSAIAASAMTKPLDAAQPSLRKLYDYLRITGEWTGGTVRLGALEDPNDLDSIEWFYSAALAREHFFERDTPYIVAEFSSSAVGETFRISQLLFGGELTGYDI